jgi:acyl-coenzyme A thioesterase PaaI-like protein
MTAPPERRRAATHRGDALRDLPDERRRAIADLGDALRTAVELATATEAAPEELRRCAALLRAATAPLARPARDRSTMPSADDLRAGIRMYNPVTGPGSAVAPPVRIEVVAGRAVGECTLGLAHEGPPTYAHGGISALLLDQMLGHVVNAAGRPGLTVALDVRYRAPVPLQTPLRLSAEVTESTGRTVTATGAIATAGDPHTPLVQATATFVALRPEQLAELFGATLHPGTLAPFAVP